MDALVGANQRCSMLFGERKLGFAPMLGKLSSLR